MRDVNKLRQDLVDQVQARAPGTIGERVAEALRAVPRHLFLPRVPVQTAYTDDAIVTKTAPDGRPISSSSQPTIMALMLEQLNLAPGHRILEIGAGTGYNAALMAHLVSPGGEVVSVDIDQDLVDQARVNLARAGHPEVTVVRGDGADGFAARAPYDRIIAAVGVWDLAPAWLDQLAPDGRIVVPLDLGGLQRSVAFDVEDDHLVSRSVIPCGFMRLRGPFAGPEQVYLLDTDLYLAVPDAQPVNPSALLSALAGPAAPVHTAVTATARELFNGLGLWLTVNGHRWCGLSGMTPEPGFVPLEVIDTYAITGGLITADSLGLLGPVSDTGHVVTLGYGPDGHRLATELASHVESWATANKPGSRDVSLRAYPASTPDSALPTPYVLPKRHTKLALTFPDQ